MGLGALSTETGTEMELINSDFVLNEKLNLFKNALHFEEKQRLKRSAPRNGTYRTAMPTARLLTEKV